MRVVLDTNVLISACLKPDGLEAAAVRMVLDGRARMCVTDAVWAEYRDVLFRAKFRTVREKAGKLLDELAGLAVWVAAGERVSVASDEDDNRFVECSIAGKAEYLVTGNLRHYPVEYEGIRFVNARGFIEC